MTVTFLDPLTVTPLVLSLPGAQWLVDTRRVQPEPQGLFGFLKPQPGASTHVPEELVKQGFVPSGPVRSRDTEALLAGLDVVSRPQARVVLSEATPGQAPARHQLFARAGQCSLAWFDEQAFFVSAAVPSLTLVTGLARKLTHEAPSAEPLVLVPEALSLVSAHFRGADDQVTGLERAKAEAALGGAAAVDVLVEAEVLVATDGWVAPAPAYALAQASLWSQHFLQLEFSALSPGRPPETRRFTFLGAAPHRLLSEDVTVSGRALTALRGLSGAQATELAGALFS